MQLQTDGDKERKQTRSVPIENRDVDTVISILEGTMAIFSMKIYKKYNKGQIKVPLPT